jgi:phosphoserine phosphatase
MKFKIVIFDMDGVIFEHDNFWMKLHGSLGTLHPGIELTEKYLKTDTKRLADEVIGKLWKGKSAKYFFDLIKNSRYNIGVKETVDELKKRGVKTCILTSGPVQLAERAQKELGIDFVYGNKIIIKDDVITGDYDWLSFDWDHKGEMVKRICKEHNIDVKDTVVVGDNEQDIFKARVAGLSVAFNSKSEKLKKECDFVVDNNDLRKILEWII